MPRHTAKSTCSSVDRLSLMAVYTACTVAHVRSRLPSPFPPDDVEECEEGDADDEEHQNSETGFHRLHLPACAPSRIRTHGIQNRSLALYPTELSRREVLGMEGSSGGDESARKPLHPMFLGRLLLTGEHEGADPGMLPKFGSERTLTGRFRRVRHFSGCSVRVQCRFRGGGALRVSRRATW